MGEAHPFVSWYPQLSIISLPPGALDPKKKYSRTPIGPAQCGKRDGVGPGQPGRGLAQEGSGSPESLSLLVAQAGEGAAANQSLATFGSRAFLSVFLPFTPGASPWGRSVAQGQLALPAHRAACPNATLSLVPSCVCSRLTPHAAQATLGFANHGRGYLPPRRACPGPGRLC